VLSARCLKYPPTMNRPREILSSSHTSCFFPMPVSESSCVICSDIYLFRAWRPRVLCSVFYPSSGVNVADRCDDALRPGVTRLTAHVAKGVCRRCRAPACPAFPPALSVGDPWPSSRCILQGFYRSPQIELSSCRCRGRTKSLERYLYSSTCRR